MTAPPDQLPPWRPSTAPDPQRTAPIPRPAGADAGDTPNGRGQPPRARRQDPQDGWRQELKDAPAAIDPLQVRDAEQLPGRVRLPGGPLARAAAAFALLGVVGVLPLSMAGTADTRLLAWSVGAVTLGGGAWVLATAVDSSRIPVAGPVAVLGVRVAATVQGVLLGLLPALARPGHPGSATVSAVLVCLAAAGSQLGIGARRCPCLGAPAPVLLTAAAGTALGIGGSPRMTALPELLLLLVLVQSGRRHRQAAGQLSAAAEELQEANEQLDVALEDVSRHARVDALTGIPNQEQFLDAARTAVVRSRAEGRHTAVLFFGLDRFKVVNEARGHRIGDELLRAVAARAEEAVGDDGLVARHGGDQFAVLLPGIASTQEAMAAALRLRAALQEPFDIDGESIRTGASFGVAVDHLGSDDPEDLMRHADVALYRAKDRGPSRIEVFDEALRTQVRQRLSDEAEFRAALDNGQIVPYLQPVVDMRTGQLVGAEALARWEHPVRGVLPPAAFFPIAVESGAGNLLDTCVARQAIEMRRILAPMVSETFELAINVAPRATTLDAIVAVIAAITEEIGTCPRGMSIEITEAAVVTDVATAAAALARARDLGFQVALDDFGTGFSALSLVRDLPLDILKVDRSFVAGMSHNPADTAVVACMIDLARRLGLRVIAEGIEGETDAERLLAEGAILAQGFWYSRPVPFDQFRQWLAGEVDWTLHPAQCRASASAPS